MDKKITLRDLSEITGYSRSVISRALRSHPSVAKETKKAIQEAASKHHFKVDPLASKLMSSYATKSSHNAGTVIGWLNCYSEKNIYKEHLWQKSFLEGCIKRAEYHNIRLEEFWLNDPKMSPKRLSQILWNRGIQGLILPHAKQAITTLGLNTDNVAIICLNNFFQQKRHTHVTVDDYSNLSIVLRELEERNYQRIGLILNEYIDWASKGRLVARLLRYQMFLSRDRCVPICYQYYSEDPRESLLQWVKNEKPDCIITVNGETLDWLTEAGIKVPKDVGLVNMNLTEHTSEWAGINIQQDKLSAAAVDALVAQLSRHEYGPISNPRTIILKGTWCEGKTVRPLKPSRNKDKKRGHLQDI